VPIIGGHEEEAYRWWAGRLGRWVPGCAWDPPNPTSRGICVGIRGGNWGVWLDMGGFLTACWLV